MITTESVVMMTPRHAPASGAPLRHDHESFTEYVLRLLEYWEQQEPVNEYLRRTR